MMPRAFLGPVRKAVCTPVHRLLNLIDPPVSVLIYHRVATLASDPEMLAVTPANFREQMRYLKETVPVVRFEEDWSQVAKPAVCVTFDDGYADNVLEALPILEEIGVPATFFVTTGLIKSGNAFWWHELEAVLLGEAELPALFVLDDGRHGKSWATGTPSGRRELYQELVRLMNDSDPARRDGWLQQLRFWANCGPAASRRHRAMTVPELRTLAASNWATIGAHTVTHSRLSALTPEAQHEEIAGSKKQLEAWLQREVTVFSYPFGRRSDYTAKSIASCREAGFTKAAANFPGQAHRWSDPYQTPRHLVRNWPVHLFAEKLKEFWTR